MKHPSASIAKIARPHAAHLLPRGRLFHLLDRGTDRPLIWVSAPAGSGKTSLVTSWIDDRRLACIWYQLDPSDRDAAAFFYYLRQAESGLNRRKLRLLPLFTSEYLHDLAGFARRYFEELFRRMTLPQGGADGAPGSSVLVLENYQEIPADSLFHGVLQQALDVIPEGVTVVVISRGTPPPQFARLRANNRLALVGWSDLRLSPEESGAILGLHGIDRGQGELARELHARADGWAAGLVLMMGVAQARGAGTPPPLEQRPEEVFDYFANEIFLTSGNELQSFLLQTAFAPFLTTQMAAELTGMEHAGRMLAELTRNNYFTDWRAGTTPVYQYHPLFRDFLQERARQKLSAGELGSSLRRTACVLRSAGYLSEAVELFSEAGDFEGLAGLIVCAAESLVEQGRSGTLGRWISRLPAEAFAADPWLSYWRGACLHPVDMPGSEISYSDAFHGFLARGDKSAALLAWAGVGINIITTWQDFSPLDRQITWLTPDIEGQIEAIPADQQARVLGIILLCFGFRQPWHPNLPLYEARAELLVRGNGLSLEHLLLLAGYLLLHYTKMGMLDQALVLVQVIEPRTRQRGGSVCPALILWRMLVSSYHGLTAAKQECLDALDETLALSASAGMPVYDIFSLFYGALAGFIDGDGRVVDDYLERIAAVQGAPGLIYPVVYRQILGWKQIVAGNLRPALEHVEAALELTLAHGAPIEIAINMVARAQLLFALNRRDEAGNCIEEVAAGNATYSSYIRYMLSCTQAYFAVSSGNRELGRGHLQDAMTVGSHRRILMHHFWNPGIMAVLCARALEYAIEPDYVRELIARHQLVPPAELAGGNHWPWPLRIHTLGRFEIEMQGERLVFTGKKQERPLSLLKALVVHGDQGVQTETLCDLLWPQAEGDAAHSSLKMALSRLRRLLGDPRLIDLREGRVALNRKLCWVDAWAFNDLVGRLDTLIRSGEPTGSGCEAPLPAELVNDAVGMYGGEFLRGEKLEYWELDCRDRLQRTFLKLLRKLGTEYERSECFEAAIVYYRRAQTADRLAEEFYQRLMVCHRELGQHAEAADLYLQCRSLLQSSLGITPSRQTEEIYRSLGAP